MKKHHYIILATVLFIVLFYGEDIGLNFGILGIAYAVLTAFRTEEQNRTRTFSLLIIATVTSSVAYAWYGDFPSFIATVCSMALLTYKSQQRELKSLFVVPVFALSFLTFPARIFYLDQWLPNRNSSGWGQKLFAVFIIPALFLLTFFSVYANGSSHFASVFSDYEFNFNFWEFLVKAILGFFIAFNFFHFWVPDWLYRQNALLSNEFNEKQITLNPTYSFLSLESERLSGVISLGMLNILLLFFIISFNYEQFFEVTKTAGQLSGETHERVFAVVVSIVLAIAVIIFYFKSTFNFDEKAKLLKVFARIWIWLNAVLVLSAITKNTEYIVNFGLTYKRLGVYAFLILCLIGLLLTWIKVEKKKTNAYLFNHMAWYFYGTVLAVAWINWGGIATSYNLQNGKGDYDFLVQLQYNDRQLKEHYPEKFHNDQSVSHDPEESFLSRILYREFVKD